MELKDWMQLITGWAAIAVTIWVEVRRGKPDKKGRSKRKRREKQNGFRLDLLAGTPPPILYSMEHHEQIKNTGRHEHAVRRHIRHVCIGGTTLRGCGIRRGRRACRPVRGLEAQRWRLNTSASSRSPNASA